MSVSQHPARQIIYREFIEITDTQKKNTNIYTRADGIGSPYYC